ncbi:EAL domain-containing protein [Actinoplanes sp. KI2]|uniref:putative bifunctional diguanylate cyclase/phosphodiesterase n=1 Tax=Actinoplanes sp. KI2 TaxID=2983315 RepID=UPI0021D59312|nr:bifunctional diguanylate cyclase/phosphodiesterase [Actinoplanes sp. KI2]MCU7728883.1 EAL domain-containing protein [Actinoplanes sp. KI2]
MRGWFPASGGLRDEDWKRRHRLLTVLLPASAVTLTVFGLAYTGLDRVWLLSVAAILACAVGAVLLRPRRLPSILVAAGLAVACDGFLVMSDGLTVAHFSFFVVAAALALYHDWTPFGVFLVTALAGHIAYEQSAMTHPWAWVLQYGLAVLGAAAIHVVLWRVVEAEERRAQDSLDASQAQLSMAFDETPVPMVMFAPDGRIQRCNTAYRSWLGLPDELPPDFAITDLPLTWVGHEADELLPTILRAPNACTTSTQAFQRHDDGSLIWLETITNGLYDRQDRLQSIFIHHRDITRQQEHEAALRRQVRQDSLTGLLSRSAFEVDLAELLDATDGPVCVLYLDVDRFKTINDGSGHTVGDDVLRVLATVLGLIVPRDAVIARLGGDEFVIAYPGSPDSGLDIGREVLTSLAQPLPLAGGQVKVELSIGLAMAEGRGQAEQAVRAADTAMYAAKRAGGNRLEIFNEQMQVTVQQRITAETRLRKALDGDRATTLPVWFQPIVSAAGTILGAEALVRMRTAEGEILAPGHFIGAAEETGLVVPLGEHVLASALHRLQEWQQELGYVSVNVSPRQLNEPDFVPTVAKLLADSGLEDPSRLVLEITETALLGNSTDIRDRLDAIKALGVRIALDDFGTGYSSLTWLQSVPTDIVKLDRSFVAGLAHDQRKESIISAVLWLARSLNMSVVAEGVEELADWEALRAAECPAIQGYFFSKPVAAEDFRDMLAPLREESLKTA